MALDGVELQVEEGELLALLGPSGCGKSTALRVVAGLEEPDAGSVRVDGRDVRRVAPRDRDMAMVFQSGALYPHLSVAGNIGFPLSMRGVPRAEAAARVARIASTLEIGHLLERRPHELSGGERQRAALARALVRESGVLLLDEPFSSLDAPLRLRLRGELRALHAARPRSTIHVTHDQEEAMALGTRVAVMDHGRVRQMGTIEELLDRPADRFVAAFVGMPPMNLIEGVVKAGPDGSVRLLALLHSLPSPPQEPRSAAELGSRMPAERIPSLAMLPRAWRRHDGRVAVLGVRPTDLRLSRASGGDVALKCEAAQVVPSESRLSFAGLLTDGRSSGDRARTPPASPPVQQPTGVWHSGWDMQMDMGHGATLLVRSPAGLRCPPGGAVTLEARLAHLFDAGPGGSCLDRWSEPDAP
jgi:ABC-type sugar transport system ATPase subunit